MAAVAALITCGTEDELSQREEWINETEWRSRVDESTGGD
jgi:hypothetical protein